MNGNTCADLSSMIKKKPSKQHKKSVKDTASANIKASKSKEFNNDFKTTAAKHTVNYPIHKYENDYIPNEYQYQYINTDNIRAMQYNTCIPVNPELPEEVVSKNSKMNDYKIFDNVRDFVTVYEYVFGNNVIIWDYVIGWVYITSIWKAVGHYKADVVKLINTSPEIEKKVYKTKGGCLKVQGTWVQYDIARKLASKFCYPIRYALVPVFGTDFVDMCLKIDEPGYGMFQLSVSNKHIQKGKRRKIKNVGNLVGYKNDDNSNRKDYAITENRYINDGENKNLGNICKPIKYKYAFNENKGAALTDDTEIAYLPGGFEHDKNSGTLRNQTDNLSPMSLTRKSSINSLLSQGTGKMEMVTNAGDAKSDYTNSNPNVSTTTTANNSYILKRKSFTIEWNEAGTLLMIPILDNNEIDNNKHCLKLTPYIHNNYNLYGKGYNYTSIRECKDAKYGENCGVPRSLEIRNPRNRSRNSMQWLLRVVEQEISSSHRSEAPPPIPLAATLHSMPISLTRFSG